MQAEPSTRPPALWSTSLSIGIDEYQQGYGKAKPSDRMPMPRVPEWGSPTDAQDRFEDQRCGNRRGDNHHNHNDSPPDSHHS
jgi:hypothetical protein